ncbi:unnamed protein product [Dicrocoelium dendriticum]|nr:unnamed protein product [Dicrocoelium dendriticum]
MFSLSHILVNSSVSARIFPERPWAEREKRKSNPSSSCQHGIKKAVPVNGVPELKHDDSSKRQKHDIEEWRYIAELYDMQNVVAFDVTSLIASTKYLGSEPRILKVTLAAPEAWHDNRKLGSPEVRLRPFLQLVQNSTTDEPASIVLISNQPSTQTTVQKSSADRHYLCRSPTSNRAPDAPTNTMLLNQYSVVFQALGTAPST